MVTSTIKSTTTMIVTITIVFISARQRYKSCLHIYSRVKARVHPYCCKCKTRSVLGRTFRLYAGLGSGLRMSLPIGRAYTAPMWDRLSEGRGTSHCGPYFGGYSRGQDCGTGEGTLNLCALFREVSLEPLCPQAPARIELGCE